MKPESQLLYEAWRGNTPRVEELLTQRIPVDTRDGKGRTPLMLAAGNEFPDTAQVLLAAGTAPLARNKGNRAVIDYVRDTTTARMILEYIPPAFRKATANRMLFTRRELAGLALEAGAQINTRNKRGDTPLIYHCWDCGYYNVSHEVIRQLLEAGANPNAMNSHGHTPLLMALWSYQEDMVRLLLSAGAHKLPENATLHPKEAALLQSCQAQI